MTRTGVALWAVVALVAVCGCGLVVPATGPDISGCPWGYDGGTLVARAKTEVKGTDDDPVYLAERYSLKAYRFGVPNGRYTVRMHFAETYERIAAAGQRVYTVSVEGKPVLADFDPFKEAGAQFAAVVKTCRADVADGELTVEFADKVQNPMINGLGVRAPGRAAHPNNSGAPDGNTSPPRRPRHPARPFPTP